MYVVFEREVKHLKLARKHLKSKENMFFQKQQHFKQKEIAFKERESIVEEYILNPVHGIQCIKNELKEKLEKHSKNVQKFTVQMETLNLEQQLFLTLLQKKWVTGPRLL